MRMLNIQFRYIFLTEPLFLAPIFFKRPAFKAIMTGAMPYEYKNNLKG